MDYEDVYFDETGQMDDREQDCHTCGGQGWGIVGLDWDTDDAINGPYDGETETCWNCHGSGKLSDCWLF